MRESLSVGNGRADAMARRGNILRTTCLEGAQCYRSRFPHDKYLERYTVLPQ
jgi:hypothetical protein